ncbi:MAG: glycosyltransferase [Elainellaceae cyanobacterium]
MSSINPEFSIVIPTYNRPDRLRQCLQSIAQLDYPRDRIEVIVVDDGSSVPIQPVTTEFETKVSLRLVQQKNAGPANARNTGASLAQGQYLVFTDDDCQPDSAWLNALRDAIATVPDALIGGRTINALPQNIYSTASQILIDYIYDYYNQIEGNANFFASNNFAMPKASYQKLGGFDTSFPLAAGEDREFCDRWQHHNLPMHYASVMQVYHAHRLTLASFWRQHFNYGRGAYCFHRIRSQRKSQSIKVEPLKFYFKMFIYPFTQQNDWRNPMVSSLLFLSQVANVFGFFWEKWKQNSSSATATIPSS